jgi:hypothetical protein
MAADYRTEVIEDQFMVIDPWEGVVGIYPTQEAANQDIARCKKKDDAMWEMAKLFVDIAAKTIMRMHRVDRETALRLLKDAAEVTD